MSYRLFVGIDLPAETKDRLTDLFTGIPNLRWVNRDLLHLTLRFIGTADEALFKRIRESLKSVTRPGEGPVRLHCKGVGTFGRGEKCVLWVGVEPEPALLSLHGAIEAVLTEKIGLKSESQAYKPHVTLAKPKSFQRKPLAEYLKRHEDFEMAPITVTEFCLFSSVVTDKGAFYTIEERYPL